MSTAKPGELQFIAKVFRGVGVKAPPELWQTTSLELLLCVEQHCDDKTILIIKQR